MLLLLYFCPNVKKLFLLQVSSVDSQKMITKYPLVGAWQMQKKRILNIILYLLALLPTHMIHALRDAVGAIGDVKLGIKK